MAVEKMKLPTRDTIFTPAGQPGVTYVDRAHLKIEDKVGRAIHVPNQIVSLAGPSKSGKTVLCRKVLETDQYVWIEGGQVETAKGIWEKVCYELNYPKTVSKRGRSETKGGVTFGTKFIFSVDGSHLKSWETEENYALDSMASAIRHLAEHKIAMVIDDFHYLDSATRKSFLRNVKGPVFNGLKLILISVTHRGNDAVKSESELQGRVTSVSVPDWSSGDLREIAVKGFEQLNVNCPAHVMSRLAEESQKSPSLMQKLCWEMCVGIGVDKRPDKSVAVSDKYDFVPMCRRVATEAGHPIYQKLEVGPQSRKQRMKRKLRTGGTADIYKAILMAIAATGPTAIVKYDDLRLKLAEILLEDAPQKHEITSALIHLRNISRQLATDDASRQYGSDAGIDWDDEERKVDISDPYLRFYLRWHIRPVAVIPSGGRLIQGQLFSNVLSFISDTGAKRIVKLAIPKKPPNKEEE